jgi:hypothetical protein
MQGGLVYYVNGFLINIEQDENENMIHYNLRLDFVIKRHTLYDVESLITYSRMYADKIMLGVNYSKHIEHKLRAYIEFEGLDFIDDPDDAFDAIVGDIEGDNIEHAQPKIIVFESGANAKPLGQFANFQLESGENINSLNQGVVQVSRVEMAPVFDTGQEGLVMVIEADGEEDVIYPCANKDCSNAAAVQVVNQDNDINVIVRPQIAEEAEEQPEEQPAVIVEPIPEPVILENAPPVVPEVQEPLTFTIETCHQITERPYDAERISRNAREIYGMLAERINPATHAFTRFDSDDLNFILRQYDRLILNGEIANSVTRDIFKINLMWVSNQEEPALYDFDNNTFVMSISSTVIGRLFSDGTIVHTVNGVECTDQLMIVQRFIENFMIAIIAERCSQLGQEDEARIAHLLFGHNSEQFGIMSFYPVVAHPADEIVIPQNPQEPSRVEIQFIEVNEPAPQNLQAEPVIAVPEVVPLPGVLRRSFPTPELVRLELLRLLNAKREEDPPGVAVTLNNGEEVKVAAARSSEAATLENGRRIPFSDIATINENVAV